MAMSLKGCKLDNLESRNSLKLSFTNIRVLHSICSEWESLLKSNSSDILDVCQTNLDDSIDSGNFSVSGYLPLIRKIITRACSCSLCKGRLLLNGTYLQKTMRILTFVFHRLYFNQSRTSFSSVDYLLRLYARFLILFHLTYMRFSRSTHLAMCLSLETLTSIIEIG